jgi:translocation and assembly module TamB
MTEKTDKPAKPRRGVARRSARVTVGLLATVLVLVLIAVAALQTAPAKRRLAGEIEKAVTQASGLTLKIGAIEGFLPFDVVVKGAVLSDKQGRLVEIGRLRASLSPSALLDRQVVLTGLELSDVTLHRLPAAGPDNGDSGVVPALPSLPVGITVARLKLANGRIGERVFGHAVTLELDGGAALAAGGKGLRLALDARWNGGAGKATLRGAFAPLAGRLALDATAEEKKDGLLPTLAGLPDRPAYRVSVKGSGPLKTWGARITAAVSGTTLVPAEVAPLTGRDVTLAGRVRLADDGALRFQGVKVSAGKASVTADGALRDGFKRIEAKATYRIADLSGLSRAAGTALAGSVTGAAIVSGPIDGPDVEIAFEGRKLGVADLRPDRLKGTVALSGLPGKIGGRFALDGAARGVDATLKSRFALDGANRLTLREIEAAAGGVRATGALTVGLDTGTAEGALDIRAKDIAAAAKLAGIEAGGALDAKLALSAAGGKQGAAIDGRATGLSVKQDGPSVTVAALSVTGRTADVMASPAGAVTVTAEGVRAAGLALARLKLAVEGALKQGKYSIETAGQASQPFEVASAGTYTYAPGAATLKLASLRGRYGELPFAAAGPFAVAQKGEGLEVSPLTLSIDGQPVTARAALSPKAVDIRVETKGAPAALLRHVPGAPKLEGTLDAALTIAGPAAAPRGDFSFEGRGLGPAEAVKGKVPKLDLHGTGKLEKGVLTLAARISGIGSAPFTAEGRLPFTLSFAPFKADLPAGAPISGRLKGASELAALQAFLPIGESRISGRGQVALDLAGTLAAPRVTGTAAITNGRYESITTGSIIANFEMRAQGDGSAVRIERLSGSDGSGGKLSGSGKIDLTGGNLGALEAAIELTRFRVVRLDQVKAQVSGRARLTGTLTRLEASGRLTVNSAELSIAKEFKGSVETIDVVVIGKDGKPRKVKRAGSEPPEHAALPVALAFDVDVPGKTFVRGRGLDSEWKGKLKVAGTTAAPRINGKLEVVRGNVALLGKSFQIKSGTVSFAGGAVSNPDIDFQAEAKATNLTAIVRATGTAEKPVFTITSDPALPQDEVLARLLFNKEAGKLSALQAVQIANAAAELSGEGIGGGLTERLRTAAGLATLDFDSGQDGKGGPSVKVGKYIGDRIYLSVQQGKTLDSSKVGVKVDITPRISAESTVNREGDSDIGIFYRYDY